MSYFMPATIQELTEALKEKDSRTYLCAGGTDLMIKLRADKEYHYGLIDMTHLAEIQNIEERSTKIIIGSGVTMTRIEDSSLIQKELPALVKAAAMVGSAQIRNRASIGGNVANASQSADLLPVLMAHEAEAVIVNEQGIRRRISLEEFIIGREKTALQEREAILWLEIEKSSDLSGFAKVGARRSVTISKINGCIKADVRQGVIQRAAVYLGAVGLKAASAPMIEQSLQSMDLKHLDEAALKDAVYAQIEANIPDRPSKHYKKSAAFGVVMEILEELLKAGKGENNYG